MDRPVFHSDTQPQVEDSSQRQEARDSLFLVAELRVANSVRVEQVRVRNLSAGGLMAETSSPLPLGTAVEIDVRGVGPVSGKVAWNVAGRVGIAFDAEIDPLGARKPISSEVRKTKYAHPVLGIR